MCVTNNEIVARWRAEGDEAARVATLLDWPVRSDWRAAPEAMWFRSKADVEIWGRFTREALPAATARLQAAALDRAQLAARLFLPSEA